VSNTISIDLTLDKDLENEVIEELNVVIWTIKNTLNKYNKKEREYILKELKEVKK